MVDDLHGPLGQARPAARAARRLHLGLAVAAIVLLGVGALLWRTADRSPDGRVATIKAVEGLPAAPAEITAPQTAAASEGDGASGVTIVRVPGAPAPTGAFIKVPQDLRVALQPAPDMRLVEKSRFGLLPRRSSEGMRPADAYARPVETDSHLPPTAPRVAILVGGMGLNPALTAAAVSELPPAVTLGFAPYGDDLGRQVRTAREAGHEAILQVPMEGFGDPPASAMSHLLVTGLEARELLDVLHWHMGRFTGYVALAGFMGGKFTADEAALGPMLRDTADRGLFYFDDGTSARSRVPALASSLALPLVRADVVIDAAPDNAAIDAALKKLEARARDRGFAVGFASGLPASVGRIAAFARTLADRGVALVPVSAFAALQTGTTAKIAQP